MQFICSCSVCTDMYTHIKQVCTDIVCKIPQYINVTLKSRKVHLCVKEEIFVYLLETSVDLRNRIVNRSLSFRYIGIIYNTASTKINAKVATVLPGVGKWSALP